MPFIRGEKMKQHVAFGEARDSSDGSEKLNGKVPLAP
jgi:hypothetical protein